MFKNDRMPSARSAVTKLSCSFAVAGVVLFAAGCSSDITRFNEPPFGLTDSGAGRTTTPRPNAPMVRSGGDAGVSQSPNSIDSSAYQPPASSRREVIRTAALPDVGSSAPTQDRTRYVPDERTPDRRAPAAVSPSRPAPSAAPDQSVQTGGEIEVLRGDTLYGLSRRHKVSLNELMQVNGLTKPDLRPGQMLKLPAGATMATATRRAEQKKATAVVAASAPSSWGKTYQVARGDSLYKIARQFGVKTNDLQRYNGIENPRLVRPGTILKVPGAGERVGSNAPVARTETASRLSEKRPSVPKISNGSGSGSGPRVAILNSKPVTGTTPPRVLQSVKVTPPKVTSPDKTKLRWPVRGKVISKFGRRSDGTHNDGINVEVPLGTDIKAAEKGVVAYSGSELRGYGKLILVRHENGWVTAYAHNRDVLVKRGDKVARGQVIAKAGKSGQVDRPQVHFELRRDAKPVDPLPYLETL